MFFKSIFHHEGQEEHEENSKDLTHFSQPGLKYFNPFILTE